MQPKAFEKIPNKDETILHSDKGWQYQMKIYHILTLKFECVQKSLSTLFVHP